MNTASRFKLGIVILNWNHPQDTIRCLESIQKSGDFLHQVVVVDNGSEDDSVELLQSTYPDLAILKANRNIGYTGGNNIGLRYWMGQGADFILLLNDDIIVAPQALSELVNLAAADPKVGFLGPKVFTLEEPDVLLSAGGRIDRDCNARLIGLGEVDSLQYDTLTQVDFLIGCALLVKREVIEKVGFLDDDYFAYHEEVDWCYRGSQAGFQVRLAPSAIVWHPDTRQRQNSAAVTYYITRNRLLFARKHQLGWLLIARILFGMCRQLLSWSLRPKWRDKGAQRNALAQALFDFLRHHYGKWGASG